MGKPYLKQERRGAILVLTMDSPQDRNALSTHEQVDEFTAACHAANRDHAVRAVVLTGSEGNFCSGGNLRDIRARGGYYTGNPHQLAESYRQTLQQVAHAVYGLEMPTIAAVDGGAIGAGLDLACMCDIRIASDRASFCEAFVRIGLVSGIGGSWFLQQVVGYAKAAEMSFTARAVGPGEALACGLVSKVVAPEKLLDEALNLAETIAAHPGPSLRLSKRLLRHAQRGEMKDLVDVSASYQAIAQHTEEHTEAVERFLATRSRRGGTPGKTPGVPADQPE